MRDMRDAIQRGTLLVASIIFGAFGLLLISAGAWPGAFVVLSAFAGVFVSLYAKEL